MAFTPRPVRSLVCALAAGLAVCLAAVPSGAQVLDNKGRDFLMAFIPNGVTPTPPATGIELHLTGDTATTVTIEYPALSPTTTLTAQVTPGQVTIVPLRAGVRHVTFKLDGEMCNDEFCDVVGDLMSWNVEVR